MRSGSDEVSAVAQGQQTQNFGQAAAARRNSATFTPMAPMASMVVQHHGGLPNCTTLSPPGLCAPSPGMGCGAVPAPPARRQFSVCSASRPLQPGARVGVGAAIAAATSNWREEIPALQSRLEYLCTEWRGQQALIHALLHQVHAVATPTCFSVEHCDLRVFTPPHGRKFCPTIALAFGCALRYHSRVLPHMRRRPGRKSPECHLWQRLPPPPRRPVPSLPPHTLPMPPPLLPDTPRRVRLCPRLALQPAGPAKDLALVVNRLPRHLAVPTAAAMSLALAQATRRLAAMRRRRRRRRCPTCRASPPSSLSARSCCSCPLSNRRPRVAAARVWPPQRRIRSHPRRRLSSRAWRRAAPRQAAAAGAARVLRPVQMQAARWRRAPQKTR